MIGGHLPFVGIEGKVRYHDTPIETVLPWLASARIWPAPNAQGVHPPVVQPGHPVLAGVPEDWPTLLGYNSLTSKSATQILIRCDADPLLVVGSHGIGRGADVRPRSARPWLAQRARRRL